MNRLIVFAAAVLAAGAAAAQGGLPLAQRVDAIPILDAAGTAMPYPFAGGFGSAAGYLSPKPQLVDLVGDGLPDLVLTEGGSGLALYENVGKGGPGFGFRWRTDQLAGIVPGVWFRFGDLDGDGRPDLLTYGGPTLIRYYRNDGPGLDGLPTFTLLADPLLAASGEPMTTEDNSVPALFDVDADGDLDFFYGQVDRGDIALWRNDGVDASGVPRFTFVTNRYEDIEIYEPSPTCGNPVDGPARPGLLEQPPGGLPGLGGGRPSMKHGANALTFADINSDGRADLFWGDYFTRSLWYFRNDGTPTDASFTLVSQVFPLDEPLTSGGYNVPTFGDVDGDGDLDLVFGILGGLCATSQNWFDALFFYENVGTPAQPVYTLRTPRLIAGVDVGRRSAPALVDLDGDGLLDLVVANESDPTAPSTANLALYRNVGTATSPVFQLVDPDWLQLRYDFGGYGPAFGDLDSDGLPDLLVGGLNGRLAFLRNTGTATSPVFVRETDRFENVDTGQFSRPALGDINGNGLLDLLAGDANGRLRLYRNVGTPTNPSFQTLSGGLPVPEDIAYRDAIGLPEDVGDFSAPTFVDLDGDGDLDVLVGTDAGPVRVFRNTGTPSAPQFVEEAPIPAARRTTTPVAADLNGDGHVDVIMGTAGGGLLHFLNTTVGSEATPGLRGSGARLDSLPNPSSGGVTFRVDAGAARGALAVVVADALGREVARVEVPPGADRVAWEAGGAAGVYVARLESDGEPLASVRLTVVR